MVNKLNLQQVYPSPETFTQPLVAVIVTFCKSELMKDGIGTGRCLFLKTSFVLHWTTGFIVRLVALILKQFLFSRLYLFYLFALKCYHPKSWGSPLMVKNGKIVQKLILIGQKKRFMHKSQCKKTRSHFDRQLWKKNWFDCQRGPTKMDPFYRFFQIFFKICPSNKAFSFTSAQWIT